MESPVRGSLSHGRGQAGGGGNLANGCTDGPATPGAAPPGKFYELETPSPALPPGPGKSATHRPPTLHLQGEASLLEPVVRAAFGVSREEIKNAFRK